MTTGSDDDDERCSDGLSKARIVLTHSIDLFGSRW